jgi:hypothetical protein
MQIKGKRNASLGWLCGWLHALKKNKNDETFGCSGIATARPVETIKSNVKL